LSYFRWVTVIQEALDTRLQEKEGQQNDMDASKEVNLRPLKQMDLTSVSALDYSLSGRNRIEYWEKKLRKAEMSGVPSLAAEIDGKLVGFILGSATGRDYGTSQSVGWIDTILVAEKWQDKGITELLLRSIGKI
jgi:hypothetical protein